jgi:hypothetical protein
MGTYRLTVVGVTFKDLRCQLQAAIDEIESEDEFESEGDYGQMELPSAPVKQLNQSAIGLDPQAVKQLLDSSAPQELKDRAINRLLNPPILVPDPIPSFQQIVEKASTPAPSGPIPTHDSRGVPWDARVHASTKELTEKGVWRRRRGVTPQQLHEVESQGSRVPVAVPAAPMTPAVPMAPAVPVAPQAVAYQSPVFQAGQPLPAEAVAIIQAAEPVKDYTNIPIPESSERKQAHDFASFSATLISSLAKLFNDGKLTVDYINALKAYFGVPELFMVNEAQRLEMFETFAANGLITKVG